jgi:hypothetical protein
MPDANLPVVAVFPDWPAAAGAIDDLVAAGFSSDRISYITRTDDAERRNDQLAGSSELAVEAAGGRTDVAAGMIAGGMVGGVLAAGLALLVPGVGPILAGGVLASFFGGTLAGSAVGGLLGALTNLGISNEMAQQYQAEIQAGRAVVAVHAGARTTDAAEILARHGGMHIHRESESDAFSTPANP